MAFLVALRRREPSSVNPSFVLQGDRTDLDDQRHDQFVAARDLVGDVKHDKSVEDLRSPLTGDGGEVIFTTVETFRLRSEVVEHPVLSRREKAAPTQPVAA